MLRTISISVVVGTRPEIIKLSSITKELAQTPGVELDLIHTGQHYDWSMSKAFFEELSLPKPKIFLGASSITHTQQLALITVRLQRHLATGRTSWLVVEGDTNSAMAAALTAAKLRIAVAHVEAGCRSYDLSMPEELNRRIISECATLNFAPTENCAMNLMREGFPMSRITLTGHPIVEVVNGAMHMGCGAEIFDRLDIEPNRFVLATLHREENVDNSGKLRNLIKSLAEIGSTVVFPLHPRTKKRIREFRLSGYLKRDCFVVTPPLKYVDMLTLIKNAALVFTDSGGMQQEALMLGTPCLTARTTTEWMETVMAGANALVATRTREILKRSRYLLQNVSMVKSKLTRVRNPFGDGKATERIVRILLDRRISAAASKPMDFLTGGLPTSRMIKVNTNQISWTELRPFVPYVNMVLDKREILMVPDTRQALRRDQKLWMLGPTKILEKLQRLCANQYRGKGR